MTRPRKQEVDYFPHYCDHGKVLFILENHFKNDGYAVFYKIIELLARTEGHCYDCSKAENWEYLLSRMGTSEETVKSVIEKLVSMDVIDAALWGERRIWMQSFVDSISLVYGRRASGLPIKPGLLHTETPLNGINDNINPQSKVKESKVNIYPQEFLRFWNAYPNKKDKTDAFKAWKKHNGTMPGIDVLLSAIEKQKLWRARASPGEFRPEWKHPATWINKGSWADEVDVKKTGW
jgi:hypothetical protein